MMVLNYSNRAVTSCSVRCLTNKIVICDNLEYRDVLYIYPNVDMHLQVLMF